MTSPAVFTAVFITENYTSVSSIARSLPSSGYLLIVCVKIVCIYSRKEKFKNLLRKLDDLFLKTRSEQNIFKVKMHLRSYKNVEKCVTVLSVLAVSNFIVVKVIKFAIFGVWYDGILPHETWSPFDMNNHVWFNLMIIYQTMYSIFFLGGVLACDMILYSFVTLIAMYFNVLTMRLEKLNSNEDKEKFAEMVDEHENLLKLSQDLEEIFSPSILFNFVASSFLICLVGYEALTGSNSELCVQYTLFMLAALLQSLVLCNCGEKLKTASDNIRVGVYNSNWCYHQKDMKTFLVLMMQRSQRPKVLTAFKFSVLNLEAFTVVSWEIIEGLNIISP
jgi:odorant receptor